MFGIKIISEREYNELKARIEHQKKSVELTQNLYLKEKGDCESLREQLNDKMQEVNKLQERNGKLQRENKSLREFRRDTLEAMGQIDLAGFQLSYCTKKCDRCDNEQHDCQKYEFGSHHYCVIPKQTT